jgi:hypothetical protein
MVGLFVFVYSAATATESGDLPYWFKNTLFRVYFVSNEICRFRNKFAECLSVYLK